MATDISAAGPGAPMSPDELPPKGDAKKTEEELEEEDQEEQNETLLERLWGLMERIPSRAGTTFDLSLFVAQTLSGFLGHLVGWDNLLHDLVPSCCL